MARKQKKPATPVADAPTPPVEAVNPPVPPAPAPEPPAPTTTVESLLENSDLPLPEGVQPGDQPETTGGAEPGLRVEVITPPAIPVGVGSAVPEARPAKGPDADCAGYVTIRALRDADPAPTIGPFDFATAAGREARTNDVVRGVFRNGYRYRVPRAVADVLVERDWALYD